MNILKIVKIAKQAGIEIMKIYKKDFSVEYKDNNSPLTEADTKSNDIINLQLQEHFPSIPILSEENKQIEYSIRKYWKTLWLVDPLDGTKEFIKKNGEFTVNIALIENQKPVLGVICVPAKDTLYYGKIGKGAYKQIGESPPEKLLPKKSNDKLKIVVSRSHFSKETEKFINSLNKPVETVPSGSSIKICLIAEGTADIYPRLAPTMEWDTAAGHAIVNSVGKKIYSYKTKKELLYNKENLVNDWFIVDSS